MIYHVCGEPIKSRLAKSYFADITITQKSIRIAAIVQEKDPVQEKHLHCVRCSVDILPEKMGELRAYCQCCNVELTLEQAVVPSRTGGIYCEEHRKAYFSDETFKSLHTIISSKF